LRGGQWRVIWVNKKNSRRFSRRDYKAKHQSVLERWAHQKTRLSVEGFFKKEGGESNLIQARVNLQIDFGSGGKTVKRGKNDLGDQRRMNSPEKGQLNASEGTWLAGIRPYDKKLSRQYQKTNWT